MRSRQAVLRCMRTLASLVCEALLLSKRASYGHDEVFERLQASNLHKLYSVVVVHKLYNWIGQVMASTRFSKLEPVWLGNISQAC